MILFCELSFQLFCLVVDSLEDVFVGFGEGSASASHHFLGDGIEFGQLHIGESGGTAFAERSDEIAGESGAVNVHTHAHDGGGVEHGVDARFGVVAHDEAAKLQVGTQEAAGGVIPQFYFAVIVFEIRSYRPGTQIAPFANDGVAQKTVVSLVGEAEHDHVVQFAAYFTIGSQGGGSVDFGTHVDICVFAGGKGRSYATAFHHLAVGSQIDGTIGNVEDGTLGFGPGFEKYLGSSVGETGVADNPVRGAERLAGASAGNQSEIGFETLAVQQEDVIKVVDVSGLFPDRDGGRVTTLVKIGLGAPEGYDRVVVGECFAGVESVDLCRQILVGNEVAGDEEVVGGYGGRIFLGHVFGSEIGVGAGQQTFPFLAYGENPYAYVGDGAGKRQGQQFEMLLVDVEKNDIFHNRM